MRSLLSTFGAATRAIASAGDLQTLATSVVTLLVGNGAFVMAWVGGDVDGDGWMEVIAREGDATGYLDSVRIAVADVPAGQGPTGRTARSGRPFISPDVANDPLMGPWRERCLASGFRAAASFPLHSTSIPTGVLSVYAPVSGAFGEAEAEVLEDLGVAIGFAVDAMATRQARDAAEDSVRANDMWLRDAIGAIRVSIVILEAVRDDQGRLVDERVRYANAAWTASVLGPDAPDPTGRLLVAEVPSFAELLPLHQNVIDTGRPYRATIHAPEGTGGRWHNVEYVRFGDGLIAIARDVTDVHLADLARREAEDQARTSDERYRSLVEELDAIVLVRDLRSGEALCSPQAQTVLGYSPGDLAQVGFWRNLVVDEDQDRVYSAWEGEVPAVDLVYRMRRADGKVIWMSERWRSVAGPDGMPGQAYAVITDVTGRRQLEEAVIRLERLEAVSRVAAAAAHDFGNVLMAISLFQQFLAEAVSPGDPSAADIRAIGDAVDRGRELTSQLMAAGNETSDEKPVALDLAEALGRIEGMLRAIAAPATLKVRVPSGSVTWMGRRALEHAVLNLVINARDAVAGRPGGITISAALEDVDEDRASGLAPGQYLALSIEDNGAGMSPEVLSHVLEPFYTSKERGTGLGLPSAARAAEKAGGGLRIASTEGVGTAVTLVLPMMEAPTSSAGR